MVNFPFYFRQIFVIQRESKRNHPRRLIRREAFMAKWTAPVLEELSIPTGTYGSVDDPNGAQDTINGAGDASSTAS
jgi:hypothetical protein